MLLAAPTQEVCSAFTRTVLPTKIMKPTQAGNKRFVNVNGCATAACDGTLVPFAVPR